MIVVLLRHLLIARAPVAEIVALEDVRLFEQLYGSVDGGDRNPRIHLGGPVVDLLDIGMVARFRQNPGDDAPLVGHFQAPFDAEAFELRSHVSRIVECVVVRVSPKRPRPLPPDGANYYFLRRPRVPSPICLASLLRCLA